LRAAVRPGAGVGDRPAGLAAPMALAARPLHDRLPPGDELLDLAQLVSQLHGLDLRPALVGLDQALDQVIDPAVEVGLPTRLVHAVLPWHTAGRRVIRTAFGSVL